MPVPRRFLLVRRADPSGVSGTGVVAEGAVWSDGTAALRWRTTTASTAVYGSLADVVAIHGHDGSTEIRWLDHPPTAAEYIRDSEEWGSP